MNSSANQTVTLGLIQRKCLDNVEQNTGETVQSIREAAKRGAQIICLQELFRSRYFCQVEDPELFNLAEPIPGPSTETLCGIAE